MIICCNLIIILTEELLLVDKQREWLLEMESIPGGDAMKIVEKEEKDLEHVLNLGDKAKAGF